MKRHPESAPPEEQVRRGRPRNPEQVSSFTTWVPVNWRDQLRQHATKDGTSVAAVVRDVVVSRLRSLDVKR